MDQFITVAAAAAPALSPAAPPTAVAVPVAENMPWVQTLEKRGWALTLLAKAQVR